MRTIRPRRAALLAATALSLSCASAGERESQEFYDRDVLTAQQIRETGATDAYDAVARLKSLWLRSTTPTSPGDQERRTVPVTVFLDDQRLGGISHLRGIEVSAIAYIRYFRPAQAQARWGFGNAGGAILVSTRPREP